MLILRKFSFFLCIRCSQFWFVHASWYVVSWIPYGMAVFNVVVLYEWFKLNYHKLHPTTISLIHINICLTFTTTVEVKSVYILVVCMYNLSRLFSAVILSLFNKKHVNMIQNNKLRWSIILNFSDNWFNGSELFTLHHIFSLSLKSFTVLFWFQWQKLHVKYEIIQGTLGVIFSTRLEALSTKLLLTHINCETRSQLNHESTEMSSFQRVIPTSIDQRIQRQTNLNLSSNFHL